MWWRSETLANSPEHSLRRERRTEQRLVLPTRGHELETHRHPESVETHWDRNSAQPQ